MSYSESQEFFKEMVFCPTCNYALDRVQVENALHNFTCPNCRLSPIGSFYSWGSAYHKHAYELWCRSCDADLKWPTYYRRPPVYIEETKEEICV